MDIAQDGNLFPREDILEAVAQSDWRDQPVPTVAWALTALGIVVIALGAPVLAPIAMEPTTFAADGGRLWLHPLHLLARYVGSDLGLGIESTWYILSALCLGLTLPILGGALRVLGVGSRLALITSLTCLFTPIVALHGRLPSDFTAGVLGSSIVLAMAFASSDPGRSGNRGYGVRLALSLLLAVALHPFNAILAVPLLVAARTRGGITSMLPVVVAAFLAAILAPDLPSTSAAQVFRRVDVLIGFGALFVPAVLAWSGADEEEPPPTWLALWWGLGIALSVLTAVKDIGPAAPFLIPAYAALVAAVLARFARPDNASRWVLVLALVHGVMIGALPWLQSPSPAAGLAAAAPGMFRSGDQVILTESQSESAAAYLVRRRFGVPVQVVRDRSMLAEKGSDIGISPNPLGLPRVLDTESGTLTMSDTP